MVSGVILRATTALMPLVAVQPIYVHPFVAAKAASSIAALYGRRLCINMVAGGFTNDLLALDDETPHDERYERLEEYGLVMQELMAGLGPVTFQGRFYRVKNLKLTPPIPQDLRPLFFVSGSSPAGLAAARNLGATAVKYPGPSQDETSILDEGVRSGIRVGIIAREDAGEAWAVAHERFPPDRRGQIAHSMAMKVSDSAWHGQLSTMEEEPTRADPYWLTPFRNYKTFCPYLVGSYEDVSEELTRYLRLGHSMFILDVPASREELDHVRIPLDAAWSRVQQERGAG
jgi:alkanesulfonate monooxygenase